MVAEYTSASTSVGRGDIGVVSSMDKPGSPVGEAITACYALLHGRTPAFRKTLRTRLLHVTLEDLQRVAREYLIQQKPTKAVVAPVAKRQELEQLGFTVKQVN